MNEPLAHSPSSSAAVADRPGAELLPQRPPIPARGRPPLLVLTGAELERVLDLPTLVDALEAVLLAQARGQTTMPPKIYLSLPEHGGDFRAMPAYAAGLAGMKWVSVHPRNPCACGLPSVMGVVVVNDPATGLPLALLEGTVVTRRRTGAAAGVATRHLARPDAQTLGQIGCGGMASDLVRAVAAVRELTEVVLWSPHADQAATLARALAPLPVRVGTLEEAARCDIVTTATPSTAPLFPAMWIRPGTHVNAMGADAPGKQELDPALLGRARVCVDDPAQAIHSGEINVPLAAGLFREEQIVGTLGQAIAGMVPGRTNGSEITLFDSTGLAIQDLAAARVALERARELGLGIELPLG